MQETYSCPDGREVLLMFNEDTLRVEARTREGLTIGAYQFKLVDPEGEAIDLMDDTGEAVSFKLAETDLRDDWRGQGITERVMTLVADEISLVPAIGLVIEG